MQNLFKRKIFTFGIAMDQKNILNVMVLVIGKKEIWDQFMDFSGVILEQSIQQCMQTIQAKVLIN